MHLDEPFLAVTIAPTLQSRHERPALRSGAIAEVAGEIVSTARELAARGWTPATSSNYNLVVIRLARE